jgi:hypothetical protein
MSDRDTVDFTAAALRELGLPVYRGERPKAGRGQCGVQVTGLKRVGRYCEILLPYLTGQKRAAAELVNEFILSRQSKPKGSPYSDDEIALVQRSREVNGNTRGKKTPL